MRRIYFLYLLFAVMLGNFAQYGFAEKTAELKIISDEKVYVSSEQIAVVQEGIFVNIDDRWVQTKALHSDRLGLYLTNETTVSLDWICPLCGHVNGVWYSVCQNSDCKSQEDRREEVEKMKKENEERRREAAKRKDKK